ncbi:ATP-binding protein [Clostridium sp. WB02_MRS01]|nr:ATP-binding protein [Clostridium sp. WB02_MRS01]
MIFMINIKQKEMLLGHTRLGDPVTISLNIQEMPNYHMTIQGASGSGKTHALKNYALQAAALGFPVIIIDSSGSYKLSEEEKAWGFSSAITPVTINVYQHGIDINPFQSLQLDTDLEERRVDTALRVTELFSHVLCLGSRQENTLYEAMLSMMTIMPGNIEHKIQTLLELIHDTRGAHANSLYGKLKPLFDQKIFTVDKSSFNAYKPGYVYIYDLQFFTDDTKQFLSDIILWHIWNQATLRGNINHKTFIILDEAQLFNHSSNSPIARMLTEGRKVGIGLWLGTQFINNNFSKTAISRIQQSSTKIYFKPNDCDLKGIAKEIDPNNNNWTQLLKNLKLGECIAAYTKNTSAGMRSKQILLKVPADI